MSLDQCLLEGGMVESQDVRLHVSILYIIAAYSSSTYRWYDSYLVTSLQLHRLLRTNVLLVHSYEHVLLDLRKSERE